ncbi:hypothetical protein BH23ACT10_BH23ACT10_17210 [soil metagenome]
MLVTTPCTSSTRGSRPQLTQRSSDHAEANDLVIVTIDTYFPMLIALRRATSPSVVLLRGVNEFAPDQHAALVIANLPAVADDLQRGAIVSLGPDHIRVRGLPLA